MKSSKVDKPALAFIGHYVKAQGGLVFWLTLVDCVLSAIPVLLALVSKHLLEIATGDVSGNMWAQSILLLVLAVSQVALSLLLNTLAVRSHARIEMKIKRDLLSRLFGKKWQSLNRFHSGDVLARMTADVTVVVDGIVALIPNIASMAVRLISCIAVLYWLDPRVMWAVCGLGLLFVVFSRLYSARMKKVHKAVQKTDSATRSFLQECVENIAVAKAFCASSPLLQRLDALQHSNFRAKLKRNVLSNISHAIFRVVFSCSYYIVLTWCAFGLMGGAVTVGMMTAFLQIINQIRMPFQSFTGIVPQFFSAVASAERLLKLFNLPDEEENTQTADFSSWQSIRFEKVSFAYDPDHVVLQEFDGEIKRGDFVALTGHSGIGKSTAMKLLLCLLEADSGRIVWRDANGDDHDWDIATRALFAYVPQGNMILSGTIRDNICFTRTDLSEEELRAAAKAADILEFIDGQPDGFDTEVGERGLGLSEGQIQRLAIARAVACGAPILLLDEATSALDEATEQRVLQNLRALPDKSALVISHRPYAAQVCNQNWSL